MNTLALLLAIAIGVSLGLLGGGGSTLAVPVLHYVAGLPVKPAIATSLLVVGGAALLGAIRHARAGNFDGRAAAIFGAVSAAAAYAGARLAARIPDEVQLVLFATVMLAASLLMFRRRRAPAPHERRALLPQIAAAAGVGLLTGMIGIGGGFLIVPALVAFGGLPMRRAVGTSLAVIAANALTGFVGYLGAAAIDWPLALTFVVLAGAGVFIGARLGHAVPEEALRRGFGVFLVVVAVLILVEKVTGLAAR